MHQIFTLSKVDGVGMLSNRKSLSHFFLSLSKEQKLELRTALWVCQGIYSLYNDVYYIKVTDYTIFTTYSIVLWTDLVY